MKYTYFEIENFKGIEKIRLDFNFSPKGNIYTLVGLNESGKTTILEAINFLTYKEDLDPLNLPGKSKQDVHELIPISKRSNFNEKIIIKAGFEMSDADFNKIESFASSIGYNNIEKIGKFEISQTYKFKNSKVESNQPGIYWDISLKGRKARQRKFKNLVREDWLKVIKEIRDILPRVLYFPNFLFEFPDKIYLDNTSIETKKHEFYRAVLQDVLDVIGGGINLEDHVLARAKSLEQFDKKSLESVLLKMGANITETVFKNWNKIFKKSISNKEIIVTTDKDENGYWFLQLRLKEGSDLFMITERSLGFRWFFAFLLLTQYRGFRGTQPNNVLFLLDEPASNLHPSAQTQLLNSFNNLPRDCSIVYTTHSHHMINPEWLEGTYVVKNEGLDYKDSENDYNSRKTLITLHRYREFVSNFPNQTTYFQPILDVLDYCPSKLENVPDVLMMEGKNDFYIMKYICFVLGIESEINILPGSGAGSLTDVIRLYIGWGRNFLVVLDSDSAGISQKTKYEETFGKSVIENIFSLEDIDTKWNKICTENLFEDNEKIEIQKLLYDKDTVYKKVHFNRSVQELYLKKQKFDLCMSTRENFQKIIDFYKNNVHIR